MLTLLRRPATPEGSDAELIVLLAAAKALPLERDEDRLRAKMRLIAIGRLKDPPPEVARLISRLAVPTGDGASFADALLPGRDAKTVGFHEGDFGSNPPPAGM